MLLEDYAVNYTPETLDALKRLNRDEESTIQEILKKEMGYALFVKITDHGKTNGYFGVIE